MYDDEFAGQGGSYLLDPKTGLRTRIEEPTLTADNAAIAPVSAVDMPTAKTKKPAATDPTQGA